MPLPFLTERANNYSSGQSGRLYSFKLEDTGKKYHVGFLSPHVTEVRLHYEEGSAPVFCEQQYYSPEEVKKAKEEKKVLCKLCAEQSKKFPTRKNTPSLHLVAVGYVIEHAPLNGVPVKGTKKNGGGEFDENPEKLIVISGGKGKINLKHINEGILDGDFMEKFWRFERDPQSGYIPPNAVDDKKLGKYDKEAFQAARAKWAEKSEAEVYSILLAGYANVKWDHPDFVKNGLKNPYPDDAPPADDGGDAAEAADVPEAGAID